MADGPHTGRVPPHDLNAERAVLGGVLLENEALNVVTELPLRPGDFYKDAHATIFEAMLALFAEGQPVDTVTLRERLSTAGKLQRVGGDDYLLGLTQAYYDMPLGDNGYVYTSGAVPFLPIVLAGYVPYFGMALNFSPNLQEDLLQV